MSKPQPPLDPDEFHRVVFAAYLAQDLDAVAAALILYAEAVGPPKLAPPPAHLTQAQVHAAMLRWARAVAYDVQRRVCQNPACPVHHPETSGTLIMPPLSGEH